MQIHNAIMRNIKCNNNGWLTETQIAEAFKKYHVGPWQSEGVTTPPFVYKWAALVGLHPLLLD